MHQLHLVFFEQQAPIIVLSFQIVSEVTMHICFHDVFEWLCTVRVKHIFEQKHL